MELDEFTLMDHDFDLDGWNMTEDGIFNLNERNLTLPEQEQFATAKRNELESFFANRVWEFAAPTEVDPKRTMRARFLLK